MKKHVIPCLLLVCAALAGCATATFYPHEGQSESPTHQGGAHFITQGMDVWFIGEPDRAYRILGYIEDPAGAVVDPMHKSIDSYVLQKAREVGATALIEVVTQTTPDRLADGRFGDPRWGWGMDWPSTRQIARYTAIQYTGASGTKTVEAPPAKP